MFKSSTLITLGVVLLLAVLAVNAWRENLPSGTCRYKISISVDTPEGTKTGSAVREVHFSSQPGFLGVSQQGFAYVSGQSVIVDLGKSGTLYSEMDNDGTYRILFKVIPWPNGPGGELTPAGIKYYRSLKSGKGTLSPQWIPEFERLVTFTDNADPKSVKRVDYQDLAKTFGDGVTLKNVTVEITSEPVTTGIEKYLPWLPDYYDKRLDGQRYNTIDSKFPLANALSAGAFSTDLSPHK